MGNMNCVKNRNSRKKRMDEYAMSANSFQIPVFQPDRFIWVIVTNSDYSERRKDQGFEDFIDLPEVNNDAQNVRNGIMGLGARKADIIERKNIDFKGFSDLMNEVRDKMGASH